MTKIHLLGVSPSDPQGPPRMRIALATLSPDRITLGATQELLAHLREEYLERNLAELKKCVEAGLSITRAEFLKNHMKNVFNYHYFTPIECAQEKGIPLHLIGDNREIQESRERLERMSLNPRDTEHHDFNYFKRISDKSYASWGQYVDGIIHLGDMISSLEKDIVTTVAGGIKEVAEKYGGNIVHISSLQDCLYSYIDRRQTIRAFIQGLNPTVSFLNEYVS